jgi:predicted metalloprotease with PDZ domain
MLIDARTKDVVWAYEVHKSSHGGLLLGTMAARGKQSVAEACAKHLKEFIQKSELGTETNGSSSLTITPVTPPDNGKELASQGSSTNPAPNLIGWIGVQAQSKGDVAVVTNVTTDGPGAKSGIQVGDIILALDGRLIKGKDFENAVAAVNPEHESRLITLADLRLMKCG